MPFDSSAASGLSSHRMTVSPSQLRARWIFPVDQPPIENGAVRIADGRIAELRSADAFSPLDDDSADLALIPGLINAHTHLEFSDLAAPLPAEGTFADWIRSVIAYRRGRTATVAEALAAGLRESAAAGVTTLGEIATAGWNDQIVDADAPRTVAFREAIAIDPTTMTRIESEVRDHLAEMRQHSHVVAAVSPHAPYSVHPDLFQRLVSLARRSRAPLAFHLAETREELELLANGTGPIVDFFRESGFWRPDAIPRGSSPLDYLPIMKPLPHALVIHGNYLDSEEIDFLTGNSQFTVVFCPRTHAHFRHSPHPWLELRSRGVRVALGTDGRASNPDLSLWNEVLYLRAQFPDVAPADLLAMATTSGATALGLAAEAGTLTPAKSADLAVIRLGGEDLDDPWERLLHPQSRPVAALRSGRWIAGGDAPGGAA